MGTLPYSAWEDDCVTRHLLNSNNIATSVATFGGGMRSTECYSSLKSVFGPSVIIHKLTGTQKPARKKIVDYSCVCDPTTYIHNVKPRRMLMRDLFAVPNLTV